MSRSDLLLRLYKLALSPPERDVAADFIPWLEERQGLLNSLLDDWPAQQGFEPAIERALAALVLRADHQTYERLLHCRNQIRALMQRGRRGYGSFGYS